MKKFTIFLLLIFSLQTFAQNELGSIKGIVTDERSLLFPYSKIKITPIINGKLIEEKSLNTLADDSGMFVVDNLSFGLYEVEIKVSGTKSIIRKRVNVKRIKSSQPDEKLELYSVEPCSDILEKADLTTENDKAKIVKETIEDFSFYKASKPILSTGNIKTAWLGEGKQKFILMTPSQIQHRADTKGDFEHYSFPVFKIKGTCVEISWSYFFAQGKESAKTRLYMSGEGKTYEFRKIDGKWIKKYVSGWVS